MGSISEGKGEIRAAEDIREIEPMRKSDYVFGATRRKFDGKNYFRCQQGYPRKQEAKTAAAKLRKIGYKARVVYEDGFWRIYVGTWGR